MKGTPCEHKTDSEPTNFEKAPYIFPMRGSPDYDWDNPRITA